MTGPARPPARATEASAAGRPVRERRTFKVVTMSSGAVLAKGTETRETIDVLTRIESIFDVQIYVWHPLVNTWRPLTPGEQRTLWDFRGR